MSRGYGDNVFTRLFESVWDYVYPFMKYVWPFVVSLAITGFATLVCAMGWLTPITDFFNNALKWFFSWIHPLNGSFWALEVAKFALSIAQGSFFGDVILFLPKIVLLVVGFVAALAAQGLVNVLLFVICAIIDLIIVIIAFVVMYGLVYALPIIAVITSIVLSLFYRKRKGLTYPVAENVAFVVMQIVLSISACVCYYIFALPLVL